MTEALLRSKLDSRLQTHISTVDIQPLCRVDFSRISQTALPHIGFIELVSGPTFAELYDPLYKTSFPKQGERERSDLIIDRINQDFANQRSGLAPYRIVGIRDVSGQHAIGAAQFSVLPLRRSGFAVPYLQYIYVRPENRRQDMSEILHMLTLAIATADGANMMDDSGNLSLSVPFTLMETEPPGHGEENVSRAYSRERAVIHTRGGSVAMMLRKVGGSQVMSAHVQPGLEVGEPPLTLVWILKRSPSGSRTYDVDEVGRDLIAAFYRSLRDEGFPEENIRLAEEIVGERTEGARFIMMPLLEIRSDHIQLRN